MHTAYAMSISTATFGEIAKRYIKTVLAGAKVAPATRRSALTNIRLLQRSWPGLEARAVGTITLHDCEKWFAHRAGQIMPSRLNQELNALRNILDVAQLEGHLALNPARRVRSAKAVRPRPVIPTGKQLTTVLVALHAMGNHRAADMVELLAYSGLRHDEAIALTWGDVDFDDNTFIVTGSCQGTRENRIRCVPLFPNLRHFLLNLRGQRGRVQPEDPILRTKQCKKALNQACRIAKVPHLSHQSMRHFFIKSAVEARVDYRVIAEWVGHTDGGAHIGRTYDRYSPQNSLDMAARMTFSFLPYPKMPPLPRIRS